MKAYPLGIRQKKKELRSFKNYRTTLLILVDRCATEPNVYRTFQTEYDLRQRKVDDLLETNGVYFPRQHSQFVKFTEPWV